MKSSLASDIVDHGRKRF